MLKRKALQWRVPIALLALFILLAPALSACSTNSSNPSATAAITASPATPGATKVPTPTPTPAPQTGGALVVAIPSQPTTLNFGLTNDPSTLAVLSTVESRLIGMDDKGDYQPQLLESVPTLANQGISADGRSYTIHFRPNLKWSDGETLDARDFVFTWQLMINTRYPALSRAGWIDISSIDVSSDGLTAKIQLKQASATFFTDVLAGEGDSTAGYILPRHILINEPPGSIPSLPFDQAKFVGSGPFKVAKWEEPTQIVVERNSHYFGTAPRLDRVVFRAFSDPRAAIDSLTTGEVDLAIDLPETMPPDLAQITDANVIVTPKAGGVELYAFNLNDQRDHDIFGERNLRMAVALGFNRKAVVDQLLNGQTTVATSPLDNSVYKTVRIDALAFDPDQAKQLLEQAGWIVQPDGIRERDGVRLSFTLTTVTGTTADAALRRSIQTFFIRDMRAIGIEVTPKNVPPSAGSPLGISPPADGFDMIDLSLNQRSGPELLDQLFYSGNQPGASSASTGTNIMDYQNHAVDNLLSELQTTVDPGQRSRLLNQVLTDIHYDMPVIPVYDHFQVDVARNYVEGLKPGTDTGLWWNVEDWWVNASVAKP